jgi:hypothetical protein
MVYKVGAKAALHTQPPIIRRGIEGGFDPNQAVIFYLEQKLAANPAVGAGRANDLSSGHKGLFL